LTVLYAFLSLLEVERHRRLRDVRSHSELSPDASVDRVENVRWRPNDAPRVPKRHVDDDFRTNDVVGLSEVNRTGSGRDRPTRLIEINFGWPHVYGGRPEQLHRSWARAGDPRAYEVRAVHVSNSALAYPSSNPPVIPLRVSVGVELQHAITHYDVRDAEMGSGIEQGHSSEDFPPRRNRGARKVVLVTERVAHEGLRTRRSLSGRLRTVKYADGIPAIQVEGRNVDRRAVSACHRWPLNDERCKHRRDHGDDRDLTKLRWRSGERQT